jgi:hypothetical protein
VSINHFQEETDLLNNSRNCPKYINVRELDPHPDTTPIVVHKHPKLSDGERLPDDIIKFIVDTDTIFIGSTYQATPQEAMRFPSHVGQNQRGGRKGWVRVRPSDGRTLIIPDYSGQYSATQAYSRCLRR